MGFSSKSLSKLDFEIVDCPRNDGTGTFTLRGVVPEPTPDQVTEYVAERGTFIHLLLEDHAAKAADADGKPVAPPSLEEVRAIREQAVTSVAALCGGTPSLEELQQLPWRVFQGFTAWLTGEVVDPKD